jgi:uncharacterized protein YbjT (DUF2867 family)
MILVAGGTGLVGSAIVRELRRRGKDAAVLTTSADKARKKFPGFDLYYREGDVTQPETLVGPTRGVEVVIGAQQFPNSPIEDPARGETFENVDARGTENLVRAAKEAGASRYVYLSGAGAAPDGYHWFQSKWRAEEAVRNSGMTWTIIRPSWVYGPDDRSLNRFLSMSRYLPFVPLIGNVGKQQMQPVFVDDVGRAVADSLENSVAEGQTYEIGGPEVMSMKEVVQTALEVAGRKRLLLPAPKGVMKLAASALQHLPGRPLTPDAVEFITMDALADPTAIREQLGIGLTPLREGLFTYLGSAK